MGIEFADSGCGVQAMHRKACSREKESHWVGQNGPVRLVQKARDEVLTVENGVGEDSHGKCVVNPFLGIARVRAEPAERDGLGKKHAAVGG